MSAQRPKRVLFHYPILNVGGAEMSVLRLTRALAEHGYAVELVLSTGGGALESRIGPRVRVTRLRDRTVGQRYLAARHPLRKLLWAAVDGMPYLMTRLQWLSRSLRFRFSQYDAAIVSLHGLSPSFCCRQVRARTRLQWIRNDLRLGDPEGKAIRNIRQYHHHIDHFVCVSRTAYESLTALLPEVKDKAMVLYNIIDAEEMRRRAAEVSNPYAAYGEVLKVVTVCRLADKAKGLFRMLEVHRRLLHEGLRFVWFVVGDGPDRAEFARRIEEYGVGATFVLLGQKGNPFPFYRYADVCAVLSYYEGLCGAVNEAKVMGRPVIATRVSGIEEQLIDGVSGLIVENDKDAILAGMKRLLTDASLRAQLANDLLPREILDDEYKLQQLAELL